jgi:hypothetical protein
MHDLITQYLSTLDTATIDGFRSLFYEASTRQLTAISDRYEQASSFDKEWIYDDGVSSSMIRRLGEELILICLYHAFEIQLKAIIRFERSLATGNSSSENDKLGRWDELKKHLPETVKRDSDFEQVNVLRVLVNCLKHAGIVSKELHKLAPSFGKVGEKIAADLSSLYDNYKACASSVIRQAHQAGGADLMILKRLQAS